MFSKRALTAALTLAALTLAAFAGCGPKNVPSSTSLALGGSDSGCLARAGDSILRFFQGTATEAETASTWDCVLHSLELFQTRTRGARDGVYSPQELRAFLEKYFLNDIKVSDVLLGEAMELKRTLIGGRVDALTKGDLERAAAFFGKLREQSLQLRTFMPITWEAMSARSDSEVEATASALHDAALSVGGVLQDTGVPYTFAHLDALVVQIQNWQGAKAPALLAMIHDNLGMIEMAKAALVAPAGDRISGSEWSETLSVAADWYGELLRMGALDQHYNSWMSGPGRERLVEIARRAFGMIDQALARQPHEQFTFDELNGMIEALFPNGLTVLGDRTVTVPHIEAFLKPLILRFFGGADLGLTGRAALGLTRPALERMRLRFEHWNDGSRYLEAMFAQAQQDQGGGAQPLGFFPAALQPFTLDRMLSLGKFEGPESAAGDELTSPGDLLADAVTRLQASIGADRALFPGDASQIYFNGYATDRHLSLHDLSEVNWKYELARILTSGYAEDPARAATSDDLTQKITFAEFKKFVGDINDIGVDVKYVDPTDPLLAEKRFREGELFTYAGTGSEFLSTRQTGQLLALMVSGELLAREIHKEVVNSGCQTFGMDMFECPLIDAKCYRKTFFDRIDHFWVNMPRLAAYYHSLAPAARADFEHAMEDGARKLGYSPGPINSSDSEGFAMIGQYVEVVFSRFDKSDSGQLGWNEAEAAFPIFKSSLHEITCQQGHCLTSDADLYAVFTYLLAYGKAPSPIAFARWRYLPFFRSLSADRGTLMRIFGMLGKPTK